jgi:hypothetical protein
MFKSAPEVNDKSIPFKPEVSELSSWLREKFSAGNWSSCAEVFKAVQGINEQALNPKQKFVFLEGINTYIKNFTKQVENSYLESSFPLSPESLAHVELITWVYAEMAKGYFNIIDTLDEQTDIAWSDERKALVLYRALQTSGMAFLHTSEVYLQPYQGFWQLCYQIYTKAEQLGVLDIEIHSNDIKSETVNSMFKHILVFELCDTNQFRAKEMRTIYQFLGGFVDYAVIFPDLNDGNSIQGVNRFQLNQDAGPVNLANHAAASTKDVRYISAIKIAKKIYQCLQESSIGKGALKSINENLFLRVVKTLGKVQKRRHTRVKEERDSPVIIGINNVISFLNSIDKENKVEIENSNANLYRDARLAGMWKIPDLNLVPLGDEVGLQMERRHRHSVNTDVRLSKIINAANIGQTNFGIWDQATIDKDKVKEDVESDVFEILDSSTRGYNARCKAGNISVRIGEVFAVVADSGERVEVGLIRRISYSANEELQLGVELIGWEAKAVCVSRPNDDDTAVWAILLPGEGALKENDSVLFESSNFLPGEFIDLRQGRIKLKCRLKKLLHSTASVSHAELFYLNTD